MEEISARLIAGMVKNGISEEAAEKIYHQLAAFADFGFAESHAASFALLVYVSAYLKVHFPQEFYCALLNAQPMGFYSSSSIVYEAQRKGIQVLGVDVSKSQWDCTIEDGKVRLGYRYIKQLGETAKKTLEGERERGKFLSVRDFVFRTGLNRQALEQLAKVGAFGCFGLSRRQALWEVLSLLNESSDELPLAVEQDSRSLPAMHITETIAADFRGMDLSNAPHPMQLLRPMLNKKGIVSAADLKRVPNRKVTTLAGMVVIRQRPVTARGFLFLTLEDETGLSNVVVKPRMLKRFRREVVYSNLLLVKGTVEKNQGVVNLIGHFFSPLQVDKTGVRLKSRDFR
jgi:error-prone DNA polymerase